MILFLSLLSILTLITLFVIAIKALIKQKKVSDIKTDFINNIRGLQNAYTGTYLLSEGSGLNDLVRSVNPALDEAINNQIEKTIAALYAIPQPFTESILSNAELVQVAVDEVKNLVTLMVDQLLPLARSVQ